MTPEERNSVKKGFLKLLDLIIKERKNTLLGKTGFTHILKENIDDIIDLKINTSLEVLLKDRIIQEIKIGNRKVLYKEEMIDRVRYIVIDCLKTFEEITTYKNSLIIEFGIMSISVIPFFTPAGIGYYNIQKRGQEKTERLTIKEGELLMYLQDGKNIKNDRETIAEDLNISKIQVSVMKNNIRNKLIRIGYTEKEVKEIIPIYTR